MERIVNRMGLVCCQFVVDMLFGNVVYNVVGNIVGKYLLGVSGDLYVGVLFGVFPTRSNYSAMNGVTEF